MKRLVAGAATTVLSLAAISGAHAQEITGGISGSITDDAGHPLGNVDVQIVYEPTHTVTHTRTSGKGFFGVRDLQVGGPYAVTASDPNHQTKTVEVGAINIGDPYALNFSLESAGTVAAVTVRASRIGGVASVKTGPVSTFTATDIQTLPTFTRDLKDVARLNPFVTLDPTNSNALIIAGSNPRFNTIYVDGVKQSDDFGLNASGYPTQRSPISIDAVKAFNVEIAPYDVQYGQFEGGVLNIVTKSGTNEFHGGAFYEYDNNNLAGQVLGNRAVGQPKCPDGRGVGPVNGVACGDRILNLKFEDRNYGGYFGGPIIKDRLFFFFDYEKFEALAPASYVASDQPGANPVPGVTSADVANITNILKNSYNYDPGGISGGVPTTDEKYFARIDANITDNQHLFVTYQNTDGNTLNFPNGSVSNTTGILPLSSNYYVLDQALEAYTADLTSRWSSNFSTELEYTHKTVDTLTQLSGDPNAAEFKIQLPSGASIYTGPDVSRQANSLSTTDDQYKARANYTIGNNVVTAGYEHEDTQSSDLFVQNANGTYTFNATCGGAGATVFTNLANKTACQLVYANAFDNNAQTAATAETTSIDTGYIQDAWHILPTLTLTGGLRYEIYSVDKSPPLNQRFVNQYGFPNNETLDGRDIIQPRFGFNWRPDPTLTVAGGLGLFSGGNPTVYFYNSFDNPGNLIGSVTCTPSSTTCASSLQNVNIDKVGAAAQAANTASTTAGTGVVNSVDPKLNIPSEWKASLSIQKTVDFGQYRFLGFAGRFLGADWKFHLDELYETVQDGLTLQDTFELQHITTPAPDGRVQFDRTRFAIPNTSPYDLELVNTHKGGGNVIAVGFGKAFANGLDFDLTYTHEDIREVTPLTSSVDVSNYRQLAYSNPNSPSVAESSYNVDHEVKLSLNYERKFFGDNRTSIRLFGDYRSGLPYSYTFQQAFPAANGTITTSSTGNYDQAFGQFALAGSGGNELLYVPKTDASGNVTATSDPIVKYAANFNLANFNQLLKSSGLIKYAGSISPRNAFTSSDVSRIDVRFEQEIPAFFPGGSKVTIYMDVINLGNLINKQWGVIKQTGFPGFQSPVQAVNCQAIAQINLSGTGRCAAGVGNFYEYRPGSAATQTLGSNSAGTGYPAWQLKFGIRYSF